MTNNARPVVVGVDGSAAAISAAQWAVDEAVERDVPLRLVYATGAPYPSSAPYAANDIAVEYGEAALRAASASIAETGKTVKLEAEILWGTPDEILIAESKHASMLCVASVGIGWVAKKVLGSTAAAVSQNGHCPVVIVRYPHHNEPGHRGRWIVVGIDDRPSADEVVAHALGEARLREATVLAVATWSCPLTAKSRADLDHRCEGWSQSHPDVRIHSTATSAGLPEFLVEIRERNIELVVICAADAHQVPQIIGPHHRPLVPYGTCSVMVVHSKDDG